MPLHPQITLDVEPGDVRIARLVSTLPYGSHTLSLAPLQTIEAVKQKVQDKEGSVGR
jgi:hypothetical protein